MSRSSEEWRKNELIEDRSYSMSSIYPGEKVANFYDHREEMLETTVALMKVMVDRNELCVMLSRLPLLTMAEGLKARGLDPAQHNNIIIIPWSALSLEELSYERMADQMGDMAAQARGQGYSGSTLIMDVPQELAERFPNLEEWFQLDRDRERMGISVVCLYDMVSLPTVLLVRSLTTYPTVIMQGMLCRNFYCLRQADSSPIDPSNDLHDHLDRLRTENVQRRMIEDDRGRLEALNLQLQEEIVRRKMVEFALLQSQNNQRIMLDAMADMVFIIDRELKVSMGNQAFIDFLEGHGLDTAFEGRTVFDIFPGLPPENRYLYDEVFRSGLTTVTDESVELTCGKVEAEVRRVPVFKGERVDRIVTIFRDQPWVEGPSTEVWDLPELLRSAVQGPQGPLGELFEKCPYPVLVHDLGGKIYHLNQVACAVLGYSRSELLRLDMSALLTDPCGSQEHHHRFNHNGRISIPAVVDRKDGSRTMVRCYLWFFGEGAEHRVIAMLHLNGGSSGN